MPEKRFALDSTLEQWRHFFAEDEAVLVEGIEHLLINQDLKRVAQRALEQAIENLKRDPYAQRSHAILFVKNKLLAMCSSRQAQELSTADLIFLQIYCHHKSVSGVAENAPINANNRKIDTRLVFLQGHINGTYAGCIPHIVHVSHIGDNDDVTLIILIEYGSLAVSSGLFDVFFAVHKVRILQMQNDLENLRPAFENLDHYVKQTLDAMKKCKYNNHEIDAAIKRFGSKWELLRKKYAELFKNSDKDLILSIESNLPGLVDALKELFRVSMNTSNLYLYLLN